MPCDATATTIKKHENQDRCGMLVVCSGLTQAACMRCVLGVDAAPGVEVFICI